MKSLTSLFFGLAASAATYAQDPDTQMLERDTFLVDPVPLSQVELAPDTIAPSLFDFTPKQEKIIDEIIAISPSIFNILEEEFAKYDAKGLPGVPYNLLSLDILNALNLEPSDIKNLENPDLFFIERYKLKDNNTLNSLVIKDSLDSDAYLSAKDFYTFLNLEMQNVRANQDFGAFDEGQYERSLIHHETPTLIGDIVDKHDLNNNSYENFAYYHHYAVYNMKLILDQNIDSIEAMYNDAQNAPETKQQMPDHEWSPDYQDFH